ncbi:MAG: hypothetical protein SCM11_20245 [Bacillota bacterium]|nr:hypothetical protein [Bacillota bacterium]
MKQIRSIIVIGIVLALILGGCGNTPTQQGSQTATTTSESLAEPGYAFKANGVTIHMHDETAPILEKLGEEKAYFEAESCAFPGLEKTYTYPSFNLYTYEDGDKDRVASIVILDDSVGTAEGIYLNSSLDEVIEKYGDKYEHTLNLYKYTSGLMELSFIIEDKIVTSIEYVALSGKASSTN